MGFSGVFYPWTLVAAKLKSIRETLEAVKASMTTGAPPEILSYTEVCRGVGFEKYWVGRPSMNISNEGEWANSNHTNKRGRFT